MLGPPELKHISLKHLKLVLHSSRNSSSSKIGVLFHEVVLSSSSLSVYITHLLTPLILSVYIYDICIVLGVSRIL